MIASHGHSKLLPMPTGSITRLPPLHLLLFVLSPMLCSTTSCLTISDDLPNLVHMLWCKRLNVSCPSIRCYCSSRWSEVRSCSSSSSAFCSSRRIEIRNLCCRQRLQSWSPST